MFRLNQKDIESYHQNYFRPSCLRGLNLRFSTWDFFAPFYEKTHDQIKVPPQLTITPEETVLNYFSILREAENIYGRGCGTIGQAKLPFPIAYNFLSQEYQKTLSYKEYVHLFSGIGHTSLIKLCRFPDRKRGIRFFYEIETIEGAEGKKAEYFGYSYGFINLLREQEGFRISEMNRIEEDFLCAPYHGWNHDGEAVVEVKYGHWCHLIQHIYPTIRNEYIKSIYFHGKDGADYCIIFALLTNGTDIEIAQFCKAGDGEWKQVYMKPEEVCAGE